MARRPPWRGLPSSTRLTAGSGSHSAEVSLVSMLIVPLFLRRCMSAISFPPTSFRLCLRSSVQDSSTSDSRGRASFLSYQPFLFERQYVPLPYWRSCLLPPGDFELPQPQAAYGAFQSARPRRGGPPPCPVSRRLKVTQNEIVAAHSRNGRSPHPSRSGVALALRISLLDFKSGDFFDYTKVWHGTLKSEGFAAFGTDFANYNLSYLYLLYLVIRLLPISCSHCHKDSIHCGRFRHGVVRGPPRPPQI